MSQIQQFNGGGGGGGGVTQTTGTFTPAVTGTTTDPTVTYDYQVGTYVKTGSQVQFAITLSVSSASGGSGNTQINLPFVSEAVANETTIFVNGANSSAAGGFALLSYELPSGSNQLAIWSGATPLDVPTFEELAGSPPLIIYVSGVYHV
jgi:hypothetical protein